MGGSLFAVGALAAWRTLGHVQDRVDIWLNPMDYYRNAQPPFSDQIVEAEFGMAWGGLIGRGFGEGDPTRVTFAESDFIIAAIGEELGPDNYATDLARFWISDPAFRFRRALAQRAASPPPTPTP